jgi:hypothetical protein
MYSRQGSVHGHDGEVLALRGLQVPSQQVLLAAHDERAVDNRGTQSVALTSGHTEANTNHPL